VTAAIMDLMWWLGSWILFGGWDHGSYGGWDNGSYGGWDNGSDVVAGIMDLM